MTSPDASLLALLAAPDDPAALTRLAAAHFAAGRLGEAASALFSSLERAPRDAAALALLGKVAACIAAAENVALPKPAPKALLAVFACDRLDHQAFFALALGHIRALPPGALTDPVLLATLERCVNLDPALERTLTALRRRLLLERQWKTAPPAFLAALARQCRNNEYVWCAEPDEETAVEALAADLAERIRRRAKLGPELLAYACYRPLTRLPGWGELGRKVPVAEAFARAFAAEEVAAAREQAKLAIPVLTGIAGGTSAAVAAMYEESPYPRWLSLTPPEPGSRPTPCEAPEVLIAGCGTGKQAVSAAFAYGPRARILAVDLSRASLAYAARMAGRYGVTVEFAQGDILNLGGLERRFDVVECSGVLHHMADPMAGWRVLAGLLKPGGVMRVALYSELARRAVNACRRIIAERGLSLPQFRREALAGRIPEAAELLAAAGDFYAASDARDLLFHVQEVQFTLPRVEACLAELGLEFVGFDLPDSMLDAVGPEGTRLARWHRLEQRHPSLFRGMYQFHCRKPA